jgi:hypothetical protein
MQKVPSCRKIVIILKFAYITHANIKYLLENLYKAEFKCKFAVGNIDTQEWTKNNAS